jgi:hypothetical protein
MRKILVVLCISMLTFWSCETDQGTSLTLKNMAAGAIYFNFLGEVTTVAAGRTVVMSDLPNGLYEYVTTYSVPAGATSSLAVGDLAGEIIIEAGTQVLILYSSEFQEDKYTIYATKSSNKNLEEDDTILFP